MSSRRYARHESIPRDVEAAIRIGFGVDDLAAAGVPYERQFAELYRANRVDLLPWLRLLARRMGRAT